MKKIEIDSKLVTSLLAETVGVYFWPSDNPFITLIKADAILNSVHFLGIISEEELKHFEEILYDNYSSFMELKKVEAKQELNKKFELNREGDNN